MVPGRKLRPPAITSHLLIRRRRNTTPGSMIINNIVRDIKNSFDDNSPLMSG